MLQDDLFATAPSGMRRRMQALFEAWAANTPGRRGAISDESAGVYRDMWIALVKWADVQGLDVPTLGPAHLDAYLRSRGGADDLQHRYAARLLRLVDRVFGHAARCGAIAQNDAVVRLLEMHPELRYAEANENDVLPDYLEAGEARALVAHLSTPHQTGKWQEQRDRAAVALHLGAGLTPGEVRALPLMSVRAGKGSLRKIHVPAGGGVAMREAPVATWAWNALERWLATREAAAVQGTWLLPATRAGREWGKTAHYEAVNAVLEAAGLPARGGAFRLRHTFALRQLKRGRGASELAAWMGVDVEVVLRYRRIVLGPIDVA